MKGVIHTAGIVKDNILSNMNWSDFSDVLGPKMQGSMNLHLLTQDRQLDLFVMFSSVAALLGNPGQASYAAGNAFIDALAHKRHLMGLPAISINWGPWAEVGMAARQSSAGYRAGHRLRGITPNQGLSLLGRLLNQDAPQVGVVPIKPGLLRQLQPVETPFMAQLHSDQPMTLARSLDGSSLIEDLFVAPELERLTLLLAYLRDRIGQVFLTDPAAIQTDLNVMETHLIRALRAFDTYRRQAIYHLAGFIEAAENGVENVKAALRCGYSGTDVLRFVRRAQQPRARRCPDQKDR